MSILSIHVNDASTPPPQRHASLFNVHIFKRIIRPSNYQYYDSHTVIKLDNTKFITIIIEIRGAY